MARKNRDRSSSGNETSYNEPRRETGGLRNTQLVRTVSRNTNRDRADYGVTTFDLDLSAFQPQREDYRDALPATPQYLRPAASYQKGRPRSVQGDSATRADSASTLLARPQDTRQPGVPSSLQTRRLLRPGPARITKMAPPKQSQLTARPDHLPAQRSATQRKEKSRDNCKQRPEPTKSRGAGGSRKFVPWCDRT